MTKLQIYTQSEIGPSIEFKMSCEKCKYLEEKEVVDGPSDWNSHYEHKCLKLNKKFENLEPLVTFSDCPYLDTEKANIILDAIENYVKV